MKPPSLRLLPGGRTVVAYFSDRVEVHDLVQLKKTLTWPTPDSVADHVSEDGKFGVLRSASGVWELFDLTQAKPTLVQRFIAPIQHPSLYRVEVLKTRMLTQTAGSIQVWDLATGRQLWKRDLEHFIGWRKNQTEIVALTERQEVSIFSVTSGETLRKFTIGMWPKTYHNNSPMVLLADERHLVGPEFDSENWIVIDIETGNQLDGPTRREDEVSRIALSPDRRRTVAFGFHQKEVVINEWPSGKKLFDVQAPEKDSYRFFHHDGIGFAHDGGILVLRRGDVHKLDPKTGDYSKLYGPWAAPPDPPADSEVAIFTFAGNKDIVSISKSRQLTVHHANGEISQPVKVPGQLSPWDVHASDDGKRHAVKCRDLDPAADDDETYIGRLHLYNVQLDRWITTECNPKAEIHRFVDGGRKICIEVFQENERLLQTVDSETGKVIATARAVRVEADVEFSVPAGEFRFINDRILWIARDGSRYQLNTERTRFDLKDRVEWRFESDDYGNASKRLAGGRLAIRGADIVNPRTGSWRSVFRGLRKPKEIVRIRGGRFVVLSAEDRAETAFVHLGDTVTGRLLYAFPVTYFGLLQVSADQKLLATLRRNIVTVWDLDAIIQDTVGKQPEWSDTEVAEAWDKLSENSDTIASLIDHPRETLAHARRVLKPAPLFDADQARSLVAQLDSDDVSQRAEALVSLRELDSRLQPIAAESLSNAKTPESKRLLKSLLAIFKEGHPIDRHAQRVMEVLYHLRTDPIIASDPKLRLLPMAILSRISRGPKAAILTIEGERALRDIESP